VPLDEVDPIPGIRAASRRLVRAWGFLNKSVAGTDMSGSAVHAIIEIGRSGNLTATKLAERLGLEKSTVSRLVSGLIARGELSEAASTQDGRAKLLGLTAQGCETLARIDMTADRQVAGALMQLDPGAQRCVAEGLRTYADALMVNAEMSTLPPEPEIRRGYAPGLIGRAVEMMATRILRDYPFGTGFEPRVAGDMAEFLPRADRPMNGIWYAKAERGIVGTITIDGEDLGDGLAHLRWFVVADGLRGRGLGRELLARALAHCDARGFREVHLWTLKGLDAARRLYDQAGFRLAEEYLGDQWGGDVIEQRLVRSAPVA